MTTFADVTTLRVGGPARRWVATDSEAELVEAVRAADDRSEPLLVLGGGSNVVVADEGFDGTVVQVGHRGIERDSDSCGGVLVTFAAGEPWDEAVGWALAEGLSGIESLSGIPGLTGATPIQNVGAYGQEVGDTLARIRAYDRHEQRVRTLAVGDLGLGYRTSSLKTAPNRFVVLDVTLQLITERLGAPIRYAELARTLDVEVGQRAPATDVRSAVLQLRRSKGMVLDAADADTRSVGSFFTNPVLDAARADELPAAAPKYPAGDGRAKTSAAWLIEQAGFAPGYGGGDARLSSKHTLAITNHSGTATAADVVALAREIREGVLARFGVELVPEPTLIGITL